MILRKVTNCVRPTWGEKVYADLCSIVRTGRINGRLRSRRNLRRPRPRLIICTKGVSNYARMSLCVGYL